MAGRITPSYDTTLETALDWYRAGKGAVIATVVETWGSSPRPVGSVLAVSGEGEMEGSVSGGCVEGAVVAEALEVVGTGESRLLTYGVSDDDAFAVGLACGGTIRISVQPVGKGIPEEIVARIVEARAAREPIAYVVDTTTWERRTASPPEFAERFRLDRSGYEEDGSAFICIYNPPLRMVVVGAVHIAQHLLPMAHACGYDPLVIDPRPAFASEARFPGEDLSDEWPDEVLAERGLDARTCVVTLTHDPKIDDPAIIAALRSDVFYLGCLGSKRTHGKRVERLKGEGFTDEDIARIHAPVGLNLGGRSPAEIAVATMAQITQVLRQG
ncbi:XdhC family protein [Pelagovum pacificum]|uniref:XdhC family protein n=1 Tax=Pelagovum pacificum TaxID=2588711 RepID=A0A5C5GEE7_9RHOB|nr:XdhC/CoxI family protein [Pelagovum pacificum]QQA41216.1 XdhC family protein [Pelagovum pacificum]TNY31976.1 XdhC family protein [Pelagovum pacificum]